MRICGARARVCASSLARGGQVLLSRAVQETSPRASPTSPPLSRPLPQPQRLPLCAARLHAAIASVLYRAALAARAPARRARGHEGAPRQGLPRSRAARGARRGRRRHWPRHCGCDALTATRRTPGPACRAQRRASTARWQLHRAGRRQSLGGCGGSRAAAAHGRTAPLRERQHRAAYMAADPARRQGRAASDATTSLTCVN